jgi:Flp pilus assembly protein TadG
MPRFVPRNRRSTRRRGVAASELAVCLPVMVLLVLATIETCTMIFLKQSLTVAAYESVRCSLQPGAVASDVQTTCDGVLTDRRINGGKLTISPANFTQLTPGQYVQITVSAPADKNSVIPGSFFKGKTLSATATMMKEF